MIPRYRSTYTVVALRGKVLVNEASTLVGEARTDTLLIGFLTRHRYCPATHSSLGDEEVRFPFGEEDTLAGAIAVLIS